MHIKDVGELVRRGWPYRGDDRPDWVLLSRLAAGFVFAFAVALVVWLGRAIWQMVWSLAVSSA